MDGWSLADRSSTKIHCKDDPRIGDHLLLTLGPCLVELGTSLICFAVHNLELALGGSGKILSLFWTSYYAQTWP